jgi:hypothetical protein
VSQGSFRRRRGSPSEGAHALPRANHDRHQGSAAPLVGAAGLHHIARDTGVDRKTVRRYIHAAQSCSLPQDRELTEGEIHEVAQRVQARPLPDPSAEWQAVEAHKDRIEAWLTKKRPLRLTKVHTLLARDGLEVS